MGGPAALVELHELGPPGPRQERPSRGCPRPPQNPSGRPQATGARRGAMPGRLPPIADPKRPRATGARAMPSFRKTPVADPRRAPPGSRRKRRRRLVSPPWPPWPGALWMAPFTRGPASATQSIRKHPGRPQATGRPRGASDAVAGKTLWPPPGARPRESSVMNLWNSCLPLLHAAERHVLILPMGRVRKQRARCWRSQAGNLRLQSRKPLLLLLGASVYSSSHAGPSIVTGVGGEVAWDS